MDPCCCYICSSCTQGCPAEMRCRFIPPCNLFTEPCHQGASNVYQSPMCNKKLIVNGANPHKNLFCSQQREMKYYVTKL